MPLFPWCTTPYSKAIHGFYKLEEQSRIQIKFQSPQASSRSALVDWIRDAAVKFKMFIPTVHLAIYLLDVFMDNHRIANDKLGVVALVCLVIAGKYEEDGRAPPVKVLRAALPPAFDSGQENIVANCERLVLRCLHWRLGWITAAHFAEYYRLFAVVNGDSDLENTPHRELQYKVRYSFDQFLDRSLQYIQLTNTLPSSKAAACLLAARIQNNVSPAWPKPLKAVTKYDFEQLSFLANFLLSSRQFDAESGYSSSSESLAKTWSSEMTP